ncbi:hypothetical protein N8T08_002395 [Aspergillus melleus]|uniref:Uncharacterized protein n=1 Tax=Aspergillus melleus TaxID=138277 RepID=A0ACC3AM37_9EURO|nr:hypothetical protein N8T08_002395 [Aspergillus melleus]
MEEDLGEAYVRSLLPTRVRSACESVILFDPAQCASGQMWIAIQSRHQLDHEERSRRSTRLGTRNSRLTHHRPQISPVNSNEEFPRRMLPGRGTESHDQGPADAHSRGDDTELIPNGHDVPSSLNCGEAESAIGIAQRICGLGNHHIDEHTTSAIPGYQTSSENPRASPSANSQRLPISLIIDQSFPPMDIVFSLLESYFDAVHWFSLVIYEPKFRMSLLSINDGCAFPSQRPFLILLSMMLAMASWYRSQRTGGDLTDKAEDFKTVGAGLLKLVESHLVDLMDIPSVTAAQTCILLGSYHVYHGRPNLSFSLLGATIKMSQSLGLHQGLSRGEFDDVEERKRVWWTVYTWDRFASITYGRPLGINDEDCNLEMPSDVLENPKFIDPPAGQSNALCYSTYQRELNQLYLIASPALKAVFGSRTLRTSEHLNGHTYFALVEKVTQHLQKWRSCLPSDLLLDLDRDFDTRSGPRLRAYALQSLSLQLTYDNVLIVLHRPLLARQVDHFYAANKRSPNESEMNTPMYPSPSVSQTNFQAESSTLGSQTISSELWMKAATRTSRITELPALAQLATDSHLVAFLAINMFNAAIVLAVMALSEPLSDTAQEVKRTITRILRLQDLLGRRSALSKQSTAVLKNVVVMLLRRESAAMLGPITANGQAVSHIPLPTEADSNSFSVEDTLRLPLDAALDPRHHLAMNEKLSDLRRAERLNDSLTSVQHGKFEATTAVQSEKVANAEK